MALHAQVFSSLAADECCVSVHVVPDSQTASITTLTPEVVLVLQLTPFPRIPNFSKGRGGCNLTGLFAQKLTSVTSGGIDHPKCGLSGKICRQEGKKTSLLHTGSGFAGRRAVSEPSGMFVLVSSQMFYHLASPIAPILPQLRLFHTRLSFHAGVFSSATHLAESLSFMPK